VDGGCLNFSSFLPFTAENGGKDYGGRLDNTGYLVKYRLISNEEK
jgi:hypothetical protein